MADQAHAGSGRRAKEVQVPEKQLKRWQKVAALAKAKDTKSQKLAVKELKKLTEVERGVFILVHVHGCHPMNARDALPRLPDDEFDDVLLSACKKLGQGGAVAGAGSAA